MLYFKWDLILALHWKVFLQARFEINFFILSISKTKSLNFQNKVSISLMISINIFNQSYYRKLMRDSRLGGIYLSENKFHLIKYLKSNIQKKC